MPTLRKSEQLKRLLTRRLREIFQRGYIRRVIGGVYVESKIHGAYHRVVRQWHADLERGDHPQPIEYGDKPKPKRDGRIRLKNLAIANIIDVLRRGADEHDIDGEIVLSDLPAALYEAARKWHGELLAAEHARDTITGKNDPGEALMLERIRKINAENECPDGDETNQRKLSND